MNSKIPSKMNNVSLGININGFFWNKNSSLMPELAIPTSQKILDKDYKVWNTRYPEPKYSNNARLLSIRLNDLILNTWDTYHIITRNHTGPFHLRTIALKIALILDGIQIHTDNIRVFHNSRSITPPTIMADNDPSNFTTGQDFRRDHCTQVGLFSFIDTTDGDPKLILNINTIDN